MTKAPRAAQELRRRYVQRERKLYAAASKLWRATAAVQRREFYAAAQRRGLYEPEISFIWNQAAGRRKRPSCPPPFPPIRSSGAGAVGPPFCSWIGFRQYLPHMEKACVSLGYCLEWESTAAARAPGGLTGEGGKICVAQPVRKDCE